MRGCGAVSVALPPPQSPRAFASRCAPRVLHRAECPVWKPPPGACWRLLRGDEERDDEDAGERCCIARTEASICRSESRWSAAERWPSVRGRSEDGGAELPVHGRLRPHVVPSSDTATVVAGSAEELLEEAGHKLVVGHGPNEHCRYVPGAHLGKKCRAFRGRELGN